MDIRTLRPLSGTVGNVVSDEHRVIERMLDAIDANLDGGAGWVVRRPKGLTWFPCRLAMGVEEVAAGDEPGLRSEVIVVRDVTATSPELLARLNDLNAHATGWVFRIDPDERVITATMWCPLTQASWWWCWVLLLTHQYQVTVAESVADELAELAGGAVAVAAHPQRGVRADLDGWITGSRLGARDPSASLDQFLTTLDFQMLLDGLGTLVDGLAVEAFSPLQIDVADGDGRLITQVRRHWHPEHGWGLQAATVASGPNDATDVEDLDSLVATAAEWNTAMAGGEASAVVLGGWVAVAGLGLVHHTFVPALAFEHVAGDARDSFGAVLALVVAQLAQSALTIVPPDVPTSDVEASNFALYDAASELQLLAGPVGWSYVQDREHQPGGTDVEEGTDAAWLVPRHVPVCSFGLFNPMGPTVSSLEVAQVGPEWVLLFVLRNPFGPRIEEWGRTAVGDDEALATLISDTLATADGGPMGPGPHWMDIFDYDEAVIDGITKFAQARDPQLLADRATELLHYFADPWARLNEADGPLQPPERAVTDPVGLWVDTITDREVVAGHQLFTRSAWEAAKAAVAEGFETAQAVSDALVVPVRERVMGDYSFRGQEGLLVQHPLT